MGGESPTFLLLSGEQKVGWVVFDSFQASTRPVYCLSLLQQPVARWFDPSPKRRAEQSCNFSAHPPESDPVSKEQYLLWVLALERSKSDVDEHVDSYERVGWGVVLVPSWMSREQQEVILK